MIVRWARPRLAAGAAVVLLAGVALFPVSTRQGVDYVVTARTLPLYAKALDFIDRDVNYRSLAAAVVPADASQEMKLRAALAWTRANIRDTPDGLPVIDDHVWHIVIRGYGQADQKADVFTTLLSYGGVEAYWMVIGPGPELVASFVNVDGSWRMVDVDNGIVFAAADGTPARVEQIAANPELAARQGPATYRGVPYGRFFEGFRAPDPPEVTRAEMQMPLARAWFEIRRTVGVDVRGWQMRATLEPS